MELDVLLAPLDAPSPCGEDCSFSTAFDTITELRRADDATLNQGEWVTSLKTSDWPGVAKHCHKLLTTQTKDLRVAMWLTEAWAQTDSYGGLARGINLCHSLCERYWQTLHPLPDGTDHEERIGNMQWLLQRIVSLCDSIPLTPGKALQLQHWHWAKLTLTAQAPEGSTPQTQPNAEAPSADTVQRQLRDITPAHWQTLLADVRACHAAVQAWQHVIDGHLGADGPSFVAAKEALAATTHELERLAKEHGASSVPHELSKPITNLAMLPPTPPTHQAVALPPAGLHSRAHALQQLQEVAHFFRQTEPHSPVAYLAEKAVKWGNMPLHEWLTHVIKDQGAMAHLEELLGVQTPRDASY